MITQNFDKIIRDFLTYYKVEVKDLNFSFNNAIPVAVLSNRNDSVQGLRNLILEVSSHKNNELNAVQDAWIEYIEAHGVNLDLLQVLKELNNYLMDKVYFVGNQIGAVDILMYYLLYNSVKKKNTFMYQGGLTRYNITRVLGCGGQLFLLADAVYIHNA